MGGFTTPRFRSSALSGFGSVPAVPSVGSARPSAFRSRTLDMLSEAPEEPEDGPGLLDYGKAAVNLGSAAAGGLISGGAAGRLLGSGVRSFLPESLKAYLPDPDQGYVRALQENQAAAEARKGRPLGLVETLGNLPGAGQVLGETVAPGTPTTAAGRIAKTVGSLVGDVALDPLTYVTGGLGAAGKAASAGKLGTAAARAIGSAPAGLVYAPEIISGVRESGGEALSKIREGDFSGAVEPGIQTALLGGLGALMATGAVKDAGDLMRRFGRATPQVQAEPSRLARAVDAQSAEPARLEDFLSQIRDEPLKLEDYATPAALDAPPASLLPLSEAVSPEVALPAAPLPFVRPEAPQTAPAVPAALDADPFVDVPAWTARYPNVLPDRNIGRTRVLSETPENYPRLEPGLLAPDGQRSLPTIHGPLVDDTQPFRRDPGLEAQQAELMAQNPEAASAFVESAEGAAAAAEKRMARKRGPVVEPEIRPAEMLEPSPQTPTDLRLVPERRVAEVEADPERRAGLERRAAIAQELQLDPSHPAVERLAAAEEQATAARTEADTDVLTGLGNRRAYESDAPSAKAAVSFDVAGLKWFNDTHGHTAGDSFLKTLGEAIREEPDVKAFRTGGDEFYLHAETPEAAEAAARNIQERLAQSKITYTQPDGSVVSWTGGRVDYGVGVRAGEANAGTSADAALLAGRARAEAAGERSPRGTRPQGLVDVPPAGRDVPNRPSPEGVEQLQPTGTDGLVREKAREVAPDPNARWEAGEKNAAPLTGRWNLANPHEALAEVVPTVAKASQRLMDPLDQVVRAASQMAGESVNLKGLTLDSSLQAAVRGKDMRVGIMSAVEQATRKYETRLQAGQYEGLDARQRAKMFSREVARHIVNPVSHEIAHAKADRMAKTDKRYAKTLDQGGHGPGYVQALREVYQRMSKGRNMLRRHIEEALDAQGGQLRDSLQQAWAEVQPLWGRLDAERAKSFEGGVRGVPNRDGGSVAVRPGSGPGETPSGSSGMRSGRVGPTAGVRESPRGSGEAPGLASGSGLRGGGSPVETPEFKRWFGRSAAVDESGAPKIVYHGTRETFDSFARTSDIGFHVGTRDQAQFRLGGNQGDQVKPVFVSVKNPLRLPDHAWSTPARLRPILDSAGIKADGMREAITRAQVAQEALDALEHSDLGLEAYRAEKAALGKEKRDAVRSAFVSGREAIEAAGYDGVVYRNEVEGEGDSYIAFRPEQIKSAIGNRGTFDPTNPDVRESARPIRPIPDKAPEVPKPTKGNVTAHPEAPKPYADKPATFWDKVREGWKAGLVSSPGTQVANALSSVGETGVRSFEAGLAGIVDRLMGGPRTRFSGEALEQLKGSVSRAPAAFKAVAEGARTVLSSEGAIGGKAGGFIRGPLQMLGVVDSGTAQLGEGAALRGRAFRQAKSELPKASSGQITQRMHEIMANPSEKLTADVEAEVRNRQYRDAADDPDSLVSSVKKLRDKHKWLHAVFPFLDTPGAIAKLTYERSPLGFKKGLDAYAKYKRAVKAGLPADDIAKLKGEAVDALAKPLAGTLAMGMFVMYAKSGGMTGSGPNDPKEKALLRETGWQPYSFVVEVDGKKVYVPYNRFEPLSSFLGFAADMSESGDAKTAGEKFEKGLGSLGQNVLSKSWFQGFADAAEFINEPRRFAGQYLANLAGSTVPNIVKKTAQAIDPITRDTRPLSTGWASVPERVGKTIASGIPGVSKLLPERKAVTGETVERPGNAASRFLSPIQITSEKPGRNLEGLMATLGVSQGAPQRQVTIPKTGVKVQLSQSEYGYLQDVDKKATEFLRRQTNDPRFKRLTKDQQAAYIERVFRSAGDEGRKKVLSRPEFRQRARTAVSESRV